MILLCKGTVPRLLPLLINKGGSDPVMHPRFGVPRAIYSICAVKREATFQNSS